MSLVVSKPGVSDLAAGHLASNRPRIAPAALAVDPEHRRLGAVGLASAAFDDPVLQRHFLGGSLWLFLGGFEFIGLSDELFHAIFEYLFSMFFLSISIMLFFSTGIITYTGLFHSREGAFLLTTPATTDRIFAYKFAESVAISSWGFFLLGSPLMAAYGITIKAPAAFYAMFVIYLLMFVLIAGSLGAIVAIVVANIFPKRQKGVLAAGIITIVVLFVALAVRLWRTPGDTLTSDWLGNVQNRLAFCQNPLWPSRWMSAGLLASARGEWPRAGYYLMVLSAHAALAYLAAAAVARDLYFRGYSRVQGSRSNRRRKWLYAIDEVFHRLFFFVPPPIRLLLLKDLRTFCRDPAQWSQFLIFFGLLAFYFLNIPRLGYGVQSPSWRSMVSFLNLSVTALILSTFTSRFIFPLLSLEGRNFWVLGLLPAGPKANSLGEICLLGRDLTAGDRRARIPERPDAGHGPGDDRAAPGDGGRAMRGSFGDQRGPGGTAAEPPRDRPFQDRRRLRRHAQPARQPRLHLRDRHLHGDSLPPLLPGHRVSRRDQPGTLARRISIRAVGGDPRQPADRRARDDHSPTNRNQGIRAHGILIARKESMRSAGDRPS